MKNRVISILIFILCISCSKSLCPLKDGYVLNNEEVHLYDISDSFNNIHIRSINYNKVHSFSDGQVDKVIQNEDGYYMVFISSEYDTLNLNYVYSNLNNVFVKVGEKINHQNVLGSLNSDKNEGEYILIFSMLQGTLKIDPRLYLDCKNISK